MKLQEPESESVTALVISCVNGVNVQIERLADAQLITAKSVDGLAQSMTHMTVQTEVYKDRYKQVQLTLQETHNSIKKLETDVEKMGKDQVYNSITRKAIWWTAGFIVAGLLTMAIQSFKIS